jgi:hypothetical protein
MTLNDGDAALVTENPADAIGANVSTAAPARATHQNERTRGDTDPPIPRNRGDDTERGYGPLTTARVTVLVYVPA